ncbi:hypothetical protein B0T10DRAFT_271527 [Thelonectria olida]|uniref:Uncharacterized protein n=1 Tax=Thelonectria olida TaxID=1576542 RepID=A0A9P8W8T8_9HYPO|nr:hypothetical protein B0T10DRAFT_271527 [Thelonectria olida]
MSQFTTRRWPRLSYLIFAASYASASLTLTNFSEIPDDVNSKNCQAAYNTPLSDCSPSDFTGKAVCSKKCRASVDDVEEAIQDDCEGVTVTDHDSLLYRALNGQLVDILCKSDGSSDDDGENNNENEADTTTAVTSETVQKQIMSTSTITKTTSAEAETTTMAEQTTSLVLAGEESSGVVASVVSSSAEATETSSGSGRGGDPFANNTSAGASLAVGYTTLVISALMCMVAVM